MLTAMLAPAGLTKKQSEEEDEVDLQEIEGVLIGPGGYAVTEDGAVISASKLTMTQLRGELTARGLSTEGKRQELYRRVQVPIYSALILLFMQPANLREYHLPRMTGILAKRD